MDEKLRQYIFQHVKEEFISSNHYDDFEGLRWDLARLIGDEEAQELDLNSIINAMELKS